MNKITKHTEDNKQQVIDLHNQQMEIYYSSGPLPTASEFSKYEVVLPGAADRILKMSEKQEFHRHSVEKIIVKTDSIRAIIGAISAFVIVLFGMGIGAYLILHSKSLEGFAAMLTPLAMIAGAFFYERWGKKTTE